MTAKRAHIRNNPWRWLRRCRVAVSLCVLALNTALFTALAGHTAIELGWAARAQIVPLALAGCFGALAGWLALTLVFGRLYCSWFCPMGALQDVFARLPRLTRRQSFRRRYTYHRPLNRLRYIWLAIVAVSAALGGGVLLTLFDPYSAFGRVAARLARPAWLWMGGHPQGAASAIAFCAAVATLCAIGATAALRGRLFCNTLCPAGSLLSVFSRNSVLRFDIDTDVCVHCGACARVCKSECIDPAAHVVDGSRCVMCFDCVAACSENAIRYTTNRKKLSIPMMRRVSEAPAPASASTSASAPVRVDRRKFMATGLLVAAAPALDSVAGYIKPMERAGESPAPRHPVVPPGRRSLTDFLDSCTGCGLCAAHCPQQVLSPSAGELGWLRALHPVLRYDRSYCRYDCTRCTEVCPTGALRPLTVDEKHIFIIGRAAVDPARCIGCSLCERWCPRRAISMKPRAGSSAAPEGAMSRYVATVDTAECVGCGECQYLCPATPVKAITVDGII